MGGAGLAERNEAENRERRLAERNEKGTKEFFFFFRLFRQGNGLEIGSLFISARGRQG
jgi:hypothetical protein